MEATVAAPVPPPQNTLAGQATPTKNTTQSPSRKKIILAAQESLERAIAATPPSPIKTADPLQRSVTTNPQSQNKNIVTPQGTWQNVVATSSPQSTLPAVQNFIQMAFETVQRSQQEVKVATQNTYKILANQPSPNLATAMFQHSLPPPFVGTPLSPQSIIPAPFRSLQSLPTPPQPHISAALQEALVKAQAAPLTTLDKSISAQIEQRNMTTSTEGSSATQTGQISNTSQVKKVSMGQTETTSKIGETVYAGYTIYNTAWPVNPKPNQTQDVSQKRAVLVAKRRQSPTVPKTVEISETKSLETQKAQSSCVSDDGVATQSLQASKPPNLSEKSQSAQASAQTSKEITLKHNASRVAQTYQAFRANQKDRGQNGPQTQSPKKSGSSQSPQRHASGSTRANGRRPPLKDLNDDVDPKRRVIVSGFPPYTQPQDLTRVLSKFGNCQVERCRNRLAVVTFDTELEAKSAIKATDELCIYGDFIEIKPFTSPRHVEELFRAYKKVISTEKGQDIIMPNKIDLTGDFYQQLENIQNAIRLTREQVQAVTNLYIDLEMVLQQEWPGCVAIPFGSIPTGLGIKSSDADCYVEVPAGLRARGPGAGAAAFVTRARRLLANYPRVFTQLVAIPRANTPIVKFRHVPSGFHCDVSSKTPLGAQNSKLIKALLEGDPRLANVAVLLKYWAKVHELSGTGRLTNYALTMMVVFYLQQPGVALAPPVARLQRDPAACYIVDHWNAGFAPRAPPPPAADVALPDLLGGFFEFYSKFDFDELVVCPYLGAAVRKKAFDEPHALPPEFARYEANVRDNLASPIRHATPFCVQDPFEQSHNVASSVSARLADDIRAYIEFAAETYAADRAAGCRTFLRTILLARPRIRRDRTVPTTKVFLIPRVRGEIVGGDWRGRAREIVLDEIFEKMLRIELELKTELEEERKEDGERKGRERRVRAKIDRERYSGAASKPVWRRKKNYSVNAPEPPNVLIARQAAATDDILAAPGEAPLEFELELGFRDEPRHFYVFAKLVEGELDVFRQFVTFLHTAMFDWFKILVRPFLAPLAEAAAEAARADQAECAAARRDATIDFENEPPRISDAADVARALRNVSLADARDADARDSDAHDADGADSSGKDQTDAC